MKFRAKVIPSGNATAVEVPTAVLTALGAGSRPLVVITINGHRWRNTVANNTWQPGIFGWQDLGAL